MEPHFEFEGGTERMADYNTSIKQLEKQLEELKGSLKISPTEGECLDLIIF